MTEDGKFQHGGISRLNTNAEATLQMDTSKKGPGAKDIPVTETFSQVTPMDHPEDDIQLPFRKTKISMTHPLHVHYSRLTPKLKFLYQERATQERTTNTPKQFGKFIGTL